MILNRHFTKVYDSPRKPLGWKPFLHALDQEIISDVTFALTGKRPETETASDNAKQKEK